MKKYLLCLWCMALACMGVVSAADSSIEVPESVRVLPATEAFRSAAGAASVSARKKIKKRVNAQKSKAMKANDFLTAELYDKAWRDLMLDLGEQAEAKGGCFLDGYVWQDRNGSKYECKNGTLVKLDDGKSYKLQVVNFDMAYWPDWDEIIVRFDAQSAAVVLLKKLPSYNPFGVYKLNMVGKCETGAKKGDSKGGESDKIARMKESWRTQYCNELSEKIAPARKTYMKELRKFMQALGKQGKVREASAVQQFAGELEKIKDPLELVEVFSAKGLGGPGKFMPKGVYPEYQWQRKENYGKLDPHTRLVFTENFGMECRGENGLVWDRWEFKGHSPGGNVLMYKERAKDREVIVFVYGDYMHRVITSNNPTYPCVRRVYAAKPDGRKE